MTTLQHSRKLFELFMALRVCNQKWWLEVQGDIGFFCGDCVFCYM